MWIRSQDETLLMDVKRIKILSKRIIGQSHGETFDTLGDYQTKERTIEVLDEIQNSLFWRNGFEIANPSYEVFQMPKE